MIKLLNLLKEGTFEKGCVMLFLGASEVNKIQDAINPKDLYEEEGDRTFGIELRPHITLLYGLDGNVSLNQVEGIINQYTFSPCKLTNISCFDNPNYDILKMDVEDELLHKVNEHLSQLPHENEFPNYHPHVTIAYLKKGLGNKYVEYFLGVTDFFIKPEFAVYSKPDGKEFKIKINID